MVLALQGSFSCTERTEQASEIPEVLTEESDYGSLLPSKRYKENLVAKLYKEALEKDPQLQDIEADAETLREATSDALADYQKYTSLNERYWEGADRYLQQIQDSSLRMTVATTLEEARTLYEQKISSGHQQANTIYMRQRQLQDQLVLLKLMATLPMIQKYQQKEQPSMKAAQQVSKQYQALMKRIAAYNSKQVKQLELSSMK